MAALRQIVAHGLRKPLLDVHDARRERPRREGVHVVHGMEQRRVDGRLEVQALVQVAQQQAEGPLILLVSAG